MIRMVSNGSRAGISVTALKVADLVKLSFDLKDAGAIARKV